MPRFVGRRLISYHRYRLQKINQLLFDQTGRLRSGWRASIFTLLFISLTIGLTLAIFGTLVASGIDIVPGSRRAFLIGSLASLVPALAAGWFCTKYLEGLPARALGASFTAGWAKHFFIGCLVGGVTLGFAVLIAVVFGGLRFEFNAAQTGSLAYSFAVSLVVFAAASAFEEALCRGYFLQTFSRSGLVWLGILITSIVFGAGHFRNPDASILAIANTVLAGLWFSVAYLKTRDLWFVWGIHLMWNWIQGSILGIEVSGLTNITSSPLLKEIDSGPVWLTGSTYGIEGGVVCTIAIIVSTAAIYFLPIAKPDPELLAMSSTREQASNQIN